MPAKRPTGSGPDPTRSALDSNTPAKGPFPCGARIEIVGALLRVKRRGRRGEDE